MGIENYFLDHSMKEKTTGVHILVPEKANKLLEASCERSKRSKRKEAAVRLEHHLITFPNHDFVRENKK